MPSRAMRLILAAVVVVALISGIDVVFGADSSLAEIPLDHWSYDAVRVLAETPLLRADELNFRANTTITRYEMALLVNKVLTRLEDLGDAENTLKSNLSPDEVLTQLFEKAQNAPGVNGSLNNQHLEIIRRLVDGFETELSILGLAKKFLPARHSTEFVWQPSSLSLDLVGNKSSELLEFSLRDRESLLVGDRRVQLNERMEIGASVVTQVGSDLSDVDEDKSVGTIGGRLTVSPNLNLVGGIATNPSRDQVDAEAVHVGADVQLGDIQLGAQYRTVKPGFTSLTNDLLAEDAETKGYDFIVRVGNVLIRTSKDTINSLSEKLDVQEVRSLGVTYELGNNTLVRADYGYTDVYVANRSQADPESPEDEGGSRQESLTRRRTAVGVGVETPKGTLELGLQYEGDRDLGGSKLGAKGASAGVKYPLPWAAETILQADVAVEEGADNSKTTSLSFGFVFREGASILVGYKMIDFSDNLGDEDIESSSSSNMATAEFSIRF